MDYHKLNEVVIPNEAAILLIVSLFINTSPGTWYAAINLSYAFSSISLNVEVFAFQGCINPIGLNRKLIDHLSLLQSTTPVHYIDGILLI